MYVCVTSIFVLFKLFLGSCEESDGYLVGRRVNVPHHPLAEPLSLLTECLFWSHHGRACRLTQPFSTRHQLPLGAYAAFPVHPSLPLSHTMTMPNTRYMAFSFLLFLSLGCSRLWIRSRLPFVSSSTVLVPTGQTGNTCLSRSFPGLRVLRRKLGLDCKCSDGLWT